MNKLRITENPTAILGQPVSAIPNYDWLDCYPVVSNGLVVGVVSAHHCTNNQDVMAGQGGNVFNAANEWFTR